MNVARLYADVLKNMIFPPWCECIVCGAKDATIYRHFVCGRCWTRLPFIRGRFCLECGKQLPHTYQSDYCPDCSIDVHYFDGARSVFYYTQPVKNIISKYKFHKNRDLYTSLSGFMVDILEDTCWTHIDYIIPVPLHRQRLKERGFNQSEWLALGIYLRKGMKVMNHILIRKQNTLSQSSLKKQDRLLNIKGAFQVVKPDAISGKNILLIDDIYTTGATINECSRTLKKYGANKIYALTLATGMNVNY